MYPVSLLKRFSKDPLKQARYTHWLDIIVHYWNYGNDFIFWLTQGTQWEVSGEEVLGDKPEWIFVLSNHRSWVDIAVLFHALHRRAPYIKYFLKRQLRKVPVMGFCWEILDYPFLDRYTRAQLEENPDLAGKDLENIATACRKFNEYPVCVIAFPEGTRFSAKKHEYQESPFNHLLKPKAGGVSTALHVMRPKLNKIVDVSISYDPPRVSFWDLVAGKLRRVRVDMREVPFPDDLLKLDPAVRESIRADYQEWLNAIWQEKDRCFRA